MKKVLILGGTRFVGPRIVKLLHSLGYDVATFSRSERNSLSTTHFQGNRDHPEDLIRALSWKPEAIIDTSLYRPDQAFNVRATLGRRPVRYIFISTAAVYSYPPAPPWFEDANVNPHTGWGKYARDKLESEIILGESRYLDLVSLRPVYFLGVGNPIKRCAYVFSRVSENKPILMPGKGYAEIQFIDVDDLASIIADLVSSSFVGILNVAGTEPLEVREFMLRCAEHVGMNFNLVECSLHEDVYDENVWPFPNLPLYVSTERLQQLGLQRMRPASEVIKREFDWWQTLPEEQRRASPEEGELSLLRKCER